MKQLKRYEDWLNLGWVNPELTKPFIEKDVSLYHACVYWNEQHETIFVKALWWHKGNRELINYFINHERQKGDYASNHFKYSAHDEGFQWWNKDRTEIVPQHVYCYWPIGTQNYTECGRKNLIPTPYTNDWGGYFYQ